MKKGIGITLVVLSVLFGLYLHIFTIFFIYANHGIVWSAIAFCSPPFPEFILAGASIHDKGILNEYLVSWIAAIFAFIIGLSMSDAESKKLQA